MADQKYSVELDISQFSANVDKLKSQLKQIEEQLTGVDKKKVFSGDQSKNTDMFTKSMGGLGKSMDMLPGPVQNVINIFNKLKTALLANPVTLIIIAIVGAFALLAKAFTSTDSGALKFEILMKQISAVVSVVFDRIKKLALGLADFLSGDFSKGVEEMGSAFDGVSENIVNATKAAKEYAEALDAIEDAQTVFISQEADMNNAIAKLNFISADQTKTSKERMEALLKSQTLEKELAKQRVEFAQQTLDAEMLSQTSILNVSNETIMGLIKGGEAYIEAITDPKKKKQAQDAWNSLAGGEQLKKLENMYAAVVNADTNYYETGKRTAGKISGFQKEQVTKAQEAAKKKEEANQKEIESLLKLIEAEAKRLEGLKKISDETIKIYEDIALLEVESNIEATKSVIENEKVTADAKRGVVEKAFTAKEAVLRKNAKTEIDILTQLLNDSKNLLGPFTPEQIQEQEVLQANLNAKIIQANGKMTKEIVSNNQAKSDAIKGISETETNLIIENLNDQMKAFDPIMKSFDKFDFSGGVKNTVKQLEEMRVKIVQVSDALKEQAKTQLDAGKINQKQYEEMVKSAGDAVQTFTDKSEETTKTAVDNSNAMRDQILQGLSTIAQEITDSIFAKQSQEIQSQLNSVLGGIDKEFSSATKNLDRMLKSRVITQAQYDKKMEKLQDEKTAKEKEVKTAAAKKQREADIKQALVNGAMAVMSGLLTQPFVPAGIIAGALAAVLAGIQISTIKNTELPVFEAGGMITGPSHKSGGVDINAQGGEFVVNKVSTQKNLGLLQDINNGGTGGSGLNRDDLRTLIEEVVSIPVVMVETDVTRSQRKVSAIESKSNWG